MQNTIIHDCVYNTDFEQPAVGKKCSIRTYKLTVSSATDIVCPLFCMGYIALILPLIVNRLTVQVYFVYILYVLRHSDAVLHMNALLS